jgi:hypothetical protein
MTHPYRDLRPAAFWRRALAELPDADVDPVISAEFCIRSSDKVATAGSCFALHIARHLRANGFNYYITEARHPIVPEGIGNEYNYGVYTARYGNIYTARQLLQLAKRAYKQFSPTEGIWVRDDGGIVDPFRAQIAPEGFLTERECLLDRERHFRCVIDMRSRIFRWQKSWMILSSSSLFCVT